MELLYVALGGLVIGMAIGYWFPGKDLRGILLVPGFAVSLIAVLWESLTWLGLPYDGFLIWGMSFGITIAATLGLAITLNDFRADADNEAFKQLRQAI